MELVRPAQAHLLAYVDALQRGWSPDNLRAAARTEQLAAISTDPAAFLERMDDPDARSGLVTLPDGTQKQRLPSFRRWIWQDGFCGTIGIRWQPGTEALPPHVAGHIGYAIVPWRRREGLASAALTGLLPDARALGLRHVDITTDIDNIASQGVIARAGGVFIKDIEMLYGKASRLYRITI